MLNIPASSGPGPVATRFYKTSAEFSPPWLKTPLEIALPDGEVVNTRIYEKAGADVFSVPQQHPELVACGAHACLKPAIRFTPPAISIPAAEKAPVSCEDNARLTFYLGRLHATLLFYSRTAVRKFLGCHCREEHVEKLSQAFMPGLMDIFRHNPEEKTRRKGLFFCQTKSNNT